MDKEEFVQIRRALGKTQSQMARLMGCSLKALQSFEQGWRTIPCYVERQILFILYMKTCQENPCKPCWEIVKCPIERRTNCPTWEYKVGNICWFINGTVCHGKIQTNWKDKMILCRKCKVFKMLLPLKKTKKNRSIPAVKTKKPGVS